MPRIGVIVTYIELYNEIKTITTGNQDIIVRLGTNDEAVQIAEEIIKDGVEVLIGRKGAVNIIRKSFEFIPVVEIEISSYDIAEAVKAAKEYSRNIAIIIHEDTLYEQRDLSNLFECNIRVYYIKKHMKKQEQIRQIIIKAISDGYEVILGGKAANDICKSLFIPCIMVNSGIESIYNAIKQAYSIIKSNDDALKSQKLISEVIENASVGIIAINNDNVIKIANRMALQLFNKKRDQVLGNILTNLLPNQLINNEERDLIIDLCGSKLMLNWKSESIDSIDIASIIIIEEVSNISRKQTNIRRSYVKKGYKAKYEFKDIKGKSKLIKDSIALAKKYAYVDSNILIQGETGTGKEIFAQSIHNYSKRKNEPFVAVNCASLTESLLESELFGYVGGAFTGALKNGKAGLFQIADGGTIFLDEIGEMSQATQAKLLRFVQEREIIRLGDDCVIPIDVRIIAATNRDLLQMVDDGKFRPDLYYRISALKIIVPPLRDRNGDIFILLEEFLNYYAKTLDRIKPVVCKECYELLSKYKWAGNVRELLNFCERVMVAFDGKQISPEIISKLLNIKTQTIIKQYDINNISDIIKRNGFNKTNAAKEMGISRTTLYKLLKQNKI